MDEVLHRGSVKADMFRGYGLMPDGESIDCHLRKGQIGSGAFPRDKVVSPGSGRLLHTLNTAVIRANTKTSNSLN